MEVRLVAFQYMAQCELVRVCVCVCGEAWGEFELGVCVCVVRRGESLSWVGMCVW